MVLNELFKALSFGPAANLAIFGEGSGMIEEANYPRILNAVNQTFTALYSRFRLRQKTLVVRAMEGRLMYPLKPIHSALSTNPLSDKFIMDTVDDPFLGDILRIELVTDALGVAYNLNDRTENCRTVFVPAPDTLQLVKFEDLEEFMVEYRASHPKLALDNTDLEQTIDLPYAYQAAFLAHLTGKIYQSLNGPENSAKGVEFLAEWERLCGEHEFHNTDVAHQSNTNIRPALNGWP